MELSSAKRAAGSTAQRCAGARPGPNQCAGGVAAMAGISVAARRSVALRYPHARRYRDRPRTPDFASQSLAGFCRRRLHRAGPFERKFEPNPFGGRARAPIGAGGDQRRRSIHHPIVGRRDQRGGSAAVEQPATGRRQPAGTGCDRRSAGGRLANRPTKNQRHAHGFGSNSTSLAGWWRGTSKDAPTGNCN